MLANGLGPDWRHPDDLRNRMLDEFLATLPKGDLWVFAYGSLIWKPGFAFVERVPATIYGLHRSFCVWSVHWRGTEKHPGLVLGLDKGGSAKGVAYRPQPADLITMSTSGVSQAAMETAFKASLGNELFGLLDSNNVIYDVQTFTSFAGTGTGITYDTSTNTIDDSGFGYNFGGQNDIVVVRVFYEWDLIIPGMSAPLANMSNNRRLLQATIAFRNEPFGNS